MSALAAKKGCLRPLLIAIILITSFSIALLYLMYTRDQYDPEESDITVWAIESVQVWDGDSLLALPQTVVIEGDEIRCVSPTCEVPDGAGRIDGRGMLLLPGLIEGQIQFYHPTKEYDGLSNPERLLRFTKQRPQVRQHLHEAGITSIRSCGDALPNILALRQQIQDGEFAGPRVFVSGPMITAPGGHPVATEYKGNEFLVKEAARQIANPDEAEGVVWELAEEQVHGIKVVYHGFGGRFPQLSKATMEATLAAAREKGLWAAVLTGTEQEMREAALAGASMIEYGARGPLSAETLQILRDHDVVWIPVLSRAAGQPALLAALQAAVQQADSAGVLIGAGSEPREGAYAGKSLLRELDLLAKAGLSPDRVVAAATSHLAHALRAADRIGYLRPGYQADLLLVQADSLRSAADLRRLSRVWQKGRLVLLAETAAE